MDLNEHTAKQFHSALLSAFPNWTDLAIMVRHQLNQRLANLAGGPEQELRATAFKLIDASEAQGRLDGLLAAALAAAPDNPELQAFAHTIG